MLNFYKIYIKIVNYKYHAWREKKEHYVSKVIYQSSALSGLDPNFLLAFTGVSPLEV